jgi:hypothetical protein
MSKIEYGVIYGDSGNFGPSLPFAASQEFLAKSGRFITFNAVTGYCEAAGDGENEIVGSTPSTLTTSAVAGDTKLPVDMDLQKIHEVPVRITAAFDADTFRKTYLFKTADLYVDADGIQHVDLDTTAADDVFYIVGYNVENQTALVKINSNKLGQSGIA